jgi:hypothetical protein
VKTARPILPIILILLLLVGCPSSSKITRDLDLVVGAVSLALPIFSLAGVPPEIIVLAQGYLKSVSEAVDATATELVSGDTPAVKAAKITGYFAAAAAFHLPPGAPAIVGQFLKVVSDAVAGFLKHFLPTQGLQAPPHYTMTRGDHQQLAKIKQKNLANLATLMSAKKP